MLYTFPIIAGLIGWFTNFIAVKMLFHPKKPVKILFFTVQGIFPKRQALLAEKLGEVVAKELFSAEDLLSQIKKTDHSSTLTVIETRLDEFINVKLSASMPMLSMFLNDDIKAKIKNTLLGEIESMLPEIIDTYGEKMIAGINIKSTVQEKVMNFSTDKLEEILYSIMKKEFRFIEVLGAVLGFLIGIIQVLLLKF